jgi:hypothetical protein
MTNTVALSASRFEAKPSGIARFALLSESRTTVEKQLAFTFAEREPTARFASNTRSEIAMSPVL